MIFIKRLSIPKWSAISVEDYQYINEINESDLSEVDKVLFIMMHLAGSTEAEMNKISVKTFLRLEKQLTKRFEVMKQLGKSVTNIGMFVFNYDIHLVTLGQYIEVQHFAKEGHIKNIHLIAASICKNGDMNHMQRADNILKLPFLKVLWNVAKFLEEFKQLNDRYKGLFGIEDTEEDEYKPVTNSFNERYGWIYSAKKVAEFEGITLEQAFELPIVQALNDLSYLKALQEYESEINKRQLSEFK